VRWTGDDSTVTSSKVSKDAATSHGEVNTAEQGDTANIR
jgi:hypothetical protein